MRLAGAGASAPNLHGGDARREPSEVSMHLFVAVLANASGARNVLAGMSRAKIPANASAVFKRAGHGSGIRVKSW